MKKTIAILILSALLSACQTFNQVEQSIFDGAEAATSTQPIEGTLP